MDTKIHPSLELSDSGMLAKEVLTRCVHCGFCNATCPTYQLTGDENDGPRGRIYLIKELLESADANEAVRHHLDRCLLCRNCETTCPSGVSYAKLYHIGQQFLDQQAPRSTHEQHKRTVLRKVMLNPSLLRPLLSAGELFKPLLPAHLKNKIPLRKKASTSNVSQNHTRHMILFKGCVQDSISPDINSATQSVLNRLGINLTPITKTACCGALSLHTSAEEEALAQMKHNIDQLWPALESGTEAIISNASGCGLMLKEYAHYLRHDSDYAEKAEKISAMTKDIAEILAQEDTQSLTSQSPQKIAWHPPCTLQHGQKITGIVEQLLRIQGHTLVSVQDSHLCCGSSGAYSIFQPDLSEQLKTNKINHLTHDKPDIIATANIGCQMHLQSATGIPVVHWITLIDTL